FYGRHSEFTRTGRANAQVGLLAPPSVAPTTVLNSAGLWGGPERGPQMAPASCADERRADKGSLHLIHGLDLGRAILAGVHPVLAGCGAAVCPRCVGGRADAGRERRVLPSNTGLLGRILDSRDFWFELGLTPPRARLETNNCDKCILL
ncbi:hypothetical protein B0H14DRAFT_2383473, partial [Mycena olivaceomarginata]